MATHYEVLGVPSDAPPAQVRRAYHDLARALHPDHLQSAPPVDRDRAARRMQEVNEAWRILGDPASRLAYDRALGLVSRRRACAVAADLSPGAVGPGFEDDDLDEPFPPGPPAEPGDVGVAVARALPWVVALVVLGIIFLVTAVAGDKRASKGPDQFVSRCISSGPASAVVTVPCDGPNEGRVVLVVDRPSLCPDGSDGRAVEDDRWLCLRPVRPIPPAERP